MNAINRLPVRTHFNCPGCDYQFNYGNDDSLVGKELPCRCGTTYIIPARNDDKPAVVKSKREPGISPEVAEAERLRMERSSVTFNCPGCNRQMGAEADMAGEVISCRRCPAWFTIPEESGMTPELVERPKGKKNTVPVKMAMPKGLGTMEAEVTQETANSMASTFLGGMLVAVGVFLMAMVGIRRK